MRTSATRIASGLIALATLTTTAAQAGPTTISDPVFTITASNASGTATYTGAYADGFLLPDPDNIYIWGAAGINLVDPNNNNPVASLGQAGITVLLDPVIGMTFEVTAGTTPTLFTITSPLVGFTGITNPEVFATSSMGITDLAGTAAGASLTGSFGGLAYRTAYNGYVPGGTTFSTQIGALASPGSTGANGDSGVVVVPGTISDMSLQVSFTLSAGDKANGTMNYSVKPEPATAALVAIGALFAARRRR